MRPDQRRLDVRGDSSNFKCRVQWASYDGSNGSSSSESYSASSGNSGNSSESVCAARYSISNCCISVSYFCSSSINVSSGSSSDVTERLSA